MMRARCHLALVSLAALVAASAGGGCRKHATAPGSDGAASAGSDGGAGSGGAPGADGATGGCVVGAGASSGPTTLACAQTTPAKVVTDGASVYWTVEASGAVLMKVPIGGGAPQVLATSDAAAFGLALDATYAYFTQPTAGRVLRVPLGGGASVTLASGVDAPLHLATDGAFLYWTGGKTQGSITRLALADGAAPTTLVGGLSRPRGIAVASGFVYWTDVADGTVLRAPTAPGDAGAGTTSDAGTAGGGGTSADGGASPAVTRLAFGLEQPADLAVRDGYVYFPDHAGRVLRVPTGGGATELLAAVAGAPFGVATDGVAVYWTAPGTPGGVFKAPVSGAGPAATIAGAELDPHFLTVDGTSVYWGDWGGGGILRTAAK
jgi:hypothetical protein